MKIEKQKVPFTQVANEVLNSKDLSLRAKGLYAYIFSKPDDWDFSAVRMKNDHKDGRDSVLSAMKELKVAGILTVKKLGNGRSDYILKHAIQGRESRPRVEDPGSGKPTVGIAHGGKSRPISNKDIYNNKDKKSNIKKMAEDKPSAETVKSDVVEGEKLTTERARMIRDIIEAFSYLNPACGKMYGNKNQRQACDDLIDTYGFEKTLFLIQKTLPKTNAKEFFPTIMTPTQLFQRWTSLVAAWEKYKGVHVSKSKGKAVTI